MSSPDIPRGTYKGERVGKPLTDEAEHFIRCPACDGWIDCRDLACVFEHHCLHRRVGHRPHLRCEAALMICGGSGRSRYMAR